MALIKAVVFHLDFGKPVMERPLDGKTEAAELFNLAQQPYDLQ